MKLYIAVCAGNTAASGNPYLGLRSVHKTLDEAKAEVNKWLNETKCESRDTEIREVEATRWNPHHWEARICISSMWEESAVCHIYEIDTDSSI